jgi:hypothetical protein
MSSTADLCDGVAELRIAVRRFESAHLEAADDPAWQQIRRAVGYMTTMVAWKEDFDRDQVLREGHAGGDLDARWDMDNLDPFV